jgi:hypothetical protein
MGIASSQILDPKRVPARFGGKPEEFYMSSPQRRQFRIMWKTVEFLGSKRSPVRL